AAALLLLQVRPSGAAPVTLSEALGRAWERAPQLDAQRIQAGLARADVWRRWLPNEPQLQFLNQDDHSWETVGVTETLGFPGKGLAASRLDRARLRAQEAEVGAKSQELLRYAVGAFLDAAVAAALVGQQEKNVADMQALSDSMRSRYDSGLASQAEMIVAELQLRQQRADLAATRDRAQAAGARLGAWLGLDAARGWELPDDVPPDALAKGGRRTPEEARALAAADVARASRSYSAWSSAPDVSLSAARNTYRVLAASPILRRQTDTYGIAVSVPLFLPAYEYVEARRARSQAVMDEAAAALALQAAQADRVQAALDYRRGRSRLSELRARDLPLAEALIESSLTAYKAGKIGLAELVLARKTLAELRTQDVQLRASLISAHLRCPGEDLGGPK
ncbi:MAG TPA: TolC family protein, partial [Elusimicrobiota bacterium]|nr:TolC family protein [Elusimicrobiota bacterium]